jgi:predicted membrane channel-forming protein YqfA (hemolysin III family)
MMPDLGQPGSHWFTASYLATTLAGLIGVLGPLSQAVEETLGPLGLFAAMLWSSVFVAGGSLGLAARLKRWYRAETTAANVVAGGVTLWAGMILYATPLGGAGTQIGIWMLGAALMQRGWSRYRRVRLDANAVLRAEVKRHLESG